MKTAMGLRVLGTLALAAALALSGGSAMAVVSAGGGSNAYTCTGGEIPSGDYSNMTITGACRVADDAVITVAGNVNVAAGAALDAHSGPSTITIARNVTAGSGSFLALGCQPPESTGNSAHPCAEGSPDFTTIAVGGNVTATDAIAVLLNGVSIHGNVTLIGGGSAIPWAIKNNTIDGNLTVSGQTTDWLGVLFNTIGRNATLTNIVVTDIHPDAPGVYIVRNTVERNLTCMGLEPGVSGGFVPGSVNIVGRNATGQCADLV